MKEKAKELGKSNAFPLYIPKEDGSEIHFGMNLREYYAGLAMQALIQTPTGEFDIAVVAFDSVTMADALIEELSKTE